MKIDLYRYAIKDYQRALVFKNDAAWQLAALSPDDRYLALVKPRIVAGTIATVIVTLFAPFVADFAVKLGPPEYFMLMLLAFTTVSAVLGKSTLRGMTALFIGLAVGCIGLDQISGQARYTGGIPELLDGIEIVLVAVGLFAVGRGAVRRALRRQVVEAAEQAEPRPHDGGATGSARCRPGCAAPRSARLSAASRPAAPRSRPS